MSSQASLSPASIPGTPRRASPVTAHPWFAALVALWFAALLGLSSLVLAPAMLERIVAASGIDTFIAAAAPPLGQTARLLVALGLATLGGLLGLILGRFLAARAQGAKLDHSDVVYVASDGVIGDEADTFGVDEPGMGLRDRLARLTGQGDGPRDFDDLPKLRARDRHPDAPGRKPLTPSDDLVADDRPPVEPGYAPAAQEVVMLAEDVAEADEPLELDVAVAEAATEDPLSPLDATAPVPAPALAPAPAPAIARAKLDSLGVVQLTERLAIAMQARRDRDARRREAAAVSADEPPIVVPSLNAVRPDEPAPAPVPAPDGSAAPNDAELGSEALEVGYSSLLDLSRRPARGEAVKAGAPQAEAVGPVAVFAGPAGGSPFPGPFSAPAVAAPFAVGPASNAEGSGVSAPSRFPAASDPAENCDPAENYRALKAALASLQRISGTR